MITFTCDGCGKSFTVPDQFAGRKAKCKGCGAPVTVPQPALVAVTAEEAEVGHVAPMHPPADVEAPEAAPAAPTKIPMRIRRLNSDFAQMQSAFQGFELIRVVSTHGTPAEKYTIEYNIKGLDRGPNKKKIDPIERRQHLVEIQMTADYPRVSPLCRMLTPIFHPNIDPSHICVGDHWVAGERLVDLVIRIGEMIAYQAYNIKSPLDAEAAMWSDLHQGELPIDSRSMRPPNLE